MRVATGLRTKIFLAAFSVAAGSLVIVALMIGVSSAGEWRVIGRSAAIALACAALLAWMVSAPIVRRMRRLVAAADRLAAGDVRDVHDPVDHAADEVGHVARALDQSVHLLGRRLDDLARDRARTQAVLSSMVEGVLIVDRRGIVQTANQAARRFLRLRDDVVRHHHVEAIRHPGITELVDTALRGEQPTALPLPLSTEEGDRQLLVRAAPVAGDGGGGAVLVLHDITDVRLTDQIRRDFVANVSHELRTPLTAIRGYLEALTDEELDADDRRQFLAIISRQTGRMERLVTDLLRLARLDARQEALTIVACDLDPIVRDVLGDLTPARQARRQQIDVRIQGEAGVVLADRAKLHDVLRNLVENAIAYAPEESTIEIDAIRANASIAIAVADRGPGIPEADLTRIFERFYRVDKSRAPDPGGTGLGLAIARHLVGLLGGEIAAANRAGGGAVVTVRLRAADSAHGRMLGQERQPS